MADDMWTDLALGSIELGLAVLVALYMVYPAARDIWRARARRRDIAAQIDTLYRWYGTGPTVVPDDHGPRFPLPLPEARRRRASLPALRKTDTRLVPITKRRH